MERQQDKLLRHQFSLIGWGLLVYLIVDQAAGTLAMCMPLVRESISLQMIAGYAARYLAAPLALWLFIRRLPKGRGPALRLSPRAFLRTFVFCMGTLYCFSVLTGMLTTLIELITGASTGDLLQNMADMLPSPLYLALACVVAPVFEELVFRKLLLDRLRPFGDAMAIGFSGVAFGLFHMNLYQFFYAAALGMVLAAVVIKTGRIWHSMLLHAMVNSCSTGISFLAEGGAVLSAAAWVLLAAFVAAAAVILVRWRRTYYMAPPAWPLTTRRVCAALVRSVGVWVCAVLGAACSVAVIFLV